MNTYSIVITDIPIGWSGTAQIWGYPKRKIHINITAPVFGDFYELFKVSTGFTLQNIRFYFSIAPIEVGDYLTEVYFLPIETNLNIQWICLFCGVRVLSPFIGKHKVGVYKLNYGIKIKIFKEINLRVGRISANNISIWYPCWYIGINASVKWSLI